jgi:hypothetical protein
MEYIRGEELNQLCRRGLSLGEFLPLEHAVELIRHAARAMGYFHAARDAGGRSHQIVHCDVSPTNLLVTEDGFLKVIDFGIARSRGQRHASEHAVPGKLSYMSPEQARRKRLDHRSDLFSLGVVLYEITLGRRLFKGPAQEVYDRLGKCDIEPPTFVRNDYPGALESIAMRALEKNPNDRYATGYEMADALDEYMREAKLLSGPMRIARYLDRLAVAAGGVRRDELVSEAEASGDDDGLDFDRGMFDGYRATTDDSPGAADDWEEFEEDEQALADVIGIDVRLVRTSARATTAEESGSLARMFTPTPTPVAAVPLDPPSPEPAKTAESPKPSAPPATRSPAPVTGPGPLLWLFLILVSGAVGAVVTYLALR